MTPPESLRAFPSLASRGENDTSVRGGAAGIGPSLVSLTWCAHEFMRHTMNH